MLRLYRPFKTLFGSTRIASRLQNGETVRVERVRITKGKAGSRILRTAFKGAVAIQLVVWAVEFALDDDEDDQKNKTGAKGDKDPAERFRGPRFIPFPLTTKIHSPEPYPPNGPEWQEFIRISKDKKMLDAIRLLTVRAVVRSTLNAPGPVRAAGGEHVKVGRVWLDVTFPFNAPPVYSQSGILVTDEMISWATVVCDPWKAQGLQRLLWPRSSALGSWAFWTASAKQTGREVAKYFGFTSEGPSNAQTRPNPAPPNPAPPNPASPPFPPSPEVQKALQRIRQEATQRPEEVNSQNPMAPSEGAPPTAPSTRRDKGITLSDKQASDQTKQEPPKEHSRAAVFLASLPHSEPWKQFKQMYLRQRGPLAVVPPRGCFRVSGLVEVRTPKVRVLVDVFAWYDPKIRTLAPGSTQLYVRRIDSNTPSL